MRIRTSASWEDEKSSVTANRKVLATNGHRNAEGMYMNYQHYPEDFASAGVSRQSKLDSSMLSNTSILQNYYSKKSHHNPARSHVDNYKQMSRFQPSYSFETDEYLIIQQHHTEVSHTSSNPNETSVNSDKYMFIDSRCTHRSNNNRPSNFKEPSVKSTTKNNTSSKGSKVDVTDNHFDSRLINGRSSSNRVRDSYRCPPNTSTTIDDYKTKTEYLLSKNKQRADQKSRAKSAGLWSRSKGEDCQQKMVENVSSQRYTAGDMNGRTASESVSNYQRNYLSNMDGRTLSENPSSNYQRNYSSNMDGRTLSENPSNSYQRYSLGNMERVSENVSNYHRYGLANINQTIDNSLDSLDDNSSVFSNTINNNNIESFKSAPSKSSTGYYSNSSYSAGYSHQKKRSLDLESSYSDSSMHSNNSSHLNSDTNSRYQLSMTSSLEDRYQNGGIDFGLVNGFDSNNNSEQNRDVDSLKTNVANDFSSDGQNGAGSSSVVPVPSSTRPLGVIQQIPRPRTYYETILSAQYSSNVNPSRTGRQRYRSIKNFTSLSRPLLIG